jgi:hypothetical protein
MAEITQIEQISEEEIIEALEDIQSIQIEPSKMITQPTPAPTPTQSSTVDELKVEISNPNEITQLLQQLLTGKTLEITIKVKK